MAIKIGITGGIGSGKSVVSRLLEIMGIPVYISDIEAKRITQTDPVIRRGLCDLVGQDVFQGGELNRSLLASYMFGHQEHVRKVNEIIHPQVKEDFRQWAARLKSELLVGSISSGVGSYECVSTPGFISICIFALSPATALAKSY